MRHTISKNLNLRDLVYEVNKNLIIVYCVSFTLEETGVFIVSDIMPLQTVFYLSIALFGVYSISSINVRKTYRLVRRYRLITYGRANQSIRKTRLTDEYMTFGFFSLIALRILLMSNVGSISLANQYKQALNGLLFVFGIIYYMKNDWSYDHRFTCRNFHIVIFLITLFGFTFRLANLDSLPPYPDEYAHLLAARSMSSPFELPEYTRSFLTVTLPVYLSFQILGESLFSARFIIVLLNSLAIIPLGLIMREIGEVESTVAMLLFSFTPWVVATSRTVREYAVLPLYFLLAVYCILTIWKNLKKTDNGKVNIIENLRILFKNKPSIISLGAPLVILFGLGAYSFIDNKSTFKFILIPIGVFGLIFITQLDYSDKLNRKLAGLIVTIGGIISFAYINTSGFVTLSPEFNNFYFGLYFNNPPQQFFHDKLGVLVYLSIAIGVIESIRRKNTLMIYIACLSSASIYFYIFHFERYSRPRYGFYAEIWYLMIISIGVSILIKISLEKSISIGRFNANTVFVLLLVLAIFSFPQAFLAVNLHESYEGTYVPITGEHHPDPENLEEVMDNRDAEVILIDRVSHVKWYYPNDIRNKEIIYYSCTDDSNGENFNKVLRQVSEKNTIAAMTWRGDRGRVCTETLPDNFEPSGGSGPYLFYKNF